MNKYQRVDREMYMKMITEPEPGLTDLPNVITITRPVSTQDEPGEWYLISCETSYEGDSMCVEKIDIVEDKVEVKE